MGADWTNSGCGKKRLRRLSGKHGIPEGEIRAMARFDPTGTNKFLGWIVEQVAGGELSLPRDGSAVMAVLNDFRRKGKSTGIPDIGKWIFTELKDKLLATESKGETTRAMVAGGQRVVLDMSHWKVIEITTAAAADKLCRPEWCIKDPKYWMKYGCGPTAPAYLVMRGGRKYACIVPHCGQMKNTDGRTPKPNKAFKNLLGKLVPQMTVDWTNDFTFFEHIARPPEEIEESKRNARDFIKACWPGGPNTFVNDQEWAYKYARFVLDARWQAGEPAIASDPRFAYEYASYVVKGRWPEGEVAIASDPELAFWYATDTVNGRWPLGEPAIANDPEWAYWYAHDIIKAKWPEGEAAIAMSSRRQEQYAELRADPLIHGQPHRIRPIRAFFGEPTNA